jgi:hypothetical protein
MAKPLLRSRIFWFNYDRHPNSFNVTTLISTTTFVDPKRHHPHFIKTTRRLRDFDPTKLHWSATAPTDLSKSALVRKTSARRVREAFKEELRHQGWNSDGTRRPEGGLDGRVRGFDLSGALRLGLVKDANAVTATTEEVRESVRWAVRTLCGLQKDSTGRQQKRPARQETSRGKSNGHLDDIGMLGVPIRRISHR